MNYTLLLLAGLSNFCFIGLKAFQQRNVIHDKYLAVFITSHLMAAMEVVVVFTIAQKGILWELILTLGTTGGLGCLAAMKLHQKVFSRPTTSIN